MSCFFHPRPCIALHKKYLTTCSLAFVVSISCYFFTPGIALCITTRCSKVIGVLTRQVISRADGSFHAIGFNDGLLGLAENPAQLRDWLFVFSLAQQPIIKTYHSMSLQCNTAKLLKYSQAISNSRIKDQVSTPDTVAKQNRLLLWSGCLATYIIGKLSMI